MSDLVKKFGIHIKVSDFDKSLRFYRAFKFTEVFTYGPEDYLKTFPNNIGKAPENYRGITFEVGGAMFEMGENHVAVKPEVFKELISSSKVSAMMDIDSVAEIRKICEENGFEIAKAEVDYPWGTRELVVKDPDGFILVFREFLK